ncbi:MAG: hypothetical protein KAJ07_00330 [Planctomycetes bacterium]|nr:hypothetical protein [Planctomycetota bacterium]
MTNRKALIVIITIFALAFAGLSAGLIKYTAYTVAEQAQETERYKGRAEAAEWSSYQYEQELYGAVWEGIE